MKVTILGYANSLGSTYTLLVGVVVGVLWLVTQPMGQLAIGAVIVAAMAAVELGDAERDVVVLHRQRRLCKLRSLLQLRCRLRRTRRRRRQTNPSCFFHPDYGARC